MATPPEQSSRSKNRKPIDWEIVGQVLGAGAAIAGWIAVVGGGRVWARLHAAEIPATQTLAVLPRELLVVEGLQTLLVPLLIGGGAALFLYYSWPATEREELSQDGRDVERERRGEASEEKVRKTAEKKQRKAAKEQRRKAETDKGQRKVETAEERKSRQEDTSEGEQPSRVPSRAEAAQSAHMDQRASENEQREPADQEAGEAHRQSPVSRGADATPVAEKQEPREKRILAPLFLLAGLVKEHDARTRGRSVGLRGPSRNSRAGHHPRQLGVAAGIVLRGSRIGDSRASRIGWLAAGGVAARGCARSAAARPRHDCRLNPGFEDCRTNQDCRLNQFSAKRPSRPAAIAPASASRTP